MSKVVPLDEDFRIDEWKDMPLRRVLRTLLLRTHSVIESSHPDMCQNVLSQNENFFTNLSTAVRRRVFLIIHFQYILSFLFQVLRKLFNLCLMITRFATSAMNPFYLIFCIFATSHLLNFFKLMQVFYCCIVQPV